MDGQQNKEEKSKTVISSDVEIVGSISCKNNVQYEGKLKGDLTCGKKVIVGEKAAIAGNLSVESVSIKGKVNGNITAGDRVELKTSANVQGDIKAKRLIIEDGVTFIGKSEVTPAGPSKSQNDQSKKNESSEKKVDDEDKSGGLFGRR